MSAVKLRPIDGQWVRATNISRSVQTYIKFSIKPTSYRRYDGNINAWEVHKSKLWMLVPVLYKYHENIDYKELPYDWIKDIKEFKNGKSYSSKKSDNRDTTSTSTYSILYILNTAPDEVVKAAYRALSLIYHPDRGGDKDKMVKINQAYTIICKERGI